jgi:DNA polymerase-4
MMTLPRDYSKIEEIKVVLLGIYIKTCVHKGSNLLILWRNNIFQVV